MRTINHRTFLGFCQYIFLIFTTFSLFLLRSDHLFGKFGNVSGAHENKQVARADFLFQVFLNFLKTVEILAAADSFGKVSRGDSVYVVLPRGINVCKNSQIAVMEGGREIFK